MDIELGAKFLAPTLKCSWILLAGQGFKQALLGKCILKAIKPNSVLPPLIFELGEENDHGIGSKTLLTEISKLEYAISYDEVKWNK